MKRFLSCLSFFAAIAFGVIAVFTPPMAVIDSSVLWFTAQLLVFTASMLGIDFKITDMFHVFKANKDKE